MVIAVNTIIQILQKLIFIIQEGQLLLGLKQILVGREVEQDQELIRRYIKQYLIPFHGMMDGTA